MKTKPRNLFIPSWIPAVMRPCLELEELIADDSTIADEAEKLGRELNANVAAYRAGTLGRPHGLCSIYRAAELSIEEFQCLQAAELRFPGVVFVAYARPLRRHDEA
ncbi:MAG: hypothetical protein ABFD82_13820 [Syntrophaceae bacterium]